MTARNLLSAACGCAPAATWKLSFFLPRSACLVLAVLLLAQSAGAQSTSDGSWSPRRGRAPWRQRGESRTPERLAQTPAARSAAPEYEYDPSYQYETAAEEVYTPAPDDAGGMYEGELFEDAAQFGPQAGGSCCDDPSCDGGCGFDHGGFDWGGLYVRADYLLWWSRGFAAPPLVTTSVAGTPREEAGVLGLPSTSVLFPTGNLATTIQNGGRVRLGYWIDPCDTTAVEGTYYALGKSSTHFSASSADYPILARPFINIETNAVGNDSELVAYPGLFSGEISVLGTSQLTGAGVIVRHALCRGCDWRVDALLGWRYNRLDDTLVVSDSKEVLSGQTGLTVGTQLSEWDRFSTRNVFNGVEFGVITEVRRCRWWFEARSTLALGNNRSYVNIDGQATAVVPLPGGARDVTVTNAGLLAQATNIGAYRDDSFAVIPQLGFNVGYEIACGLWAVAGYNFLYWCNVARPGEQIDPELNLSQLSPGGLVGLARPEFLDARTDYWAQGLNFGLAYRF